MVSVAPLSLMDARFKMGPCAITMAKLIIDKGIEPETAPETKSIDSLEEVQRRHILQMLDKTGWLN